MKNKFHFTFKNLESQYKTALDLGYSFLTCLDYSKNKNNLSKLTIVNRVDIDLSVKRMAELDDLFSTKITTLFSNIDNIEKSVRESDLVIGAVLIPGAKAPKLVSREMISQMSKGSVVIDIAVDQGGCIETCKPTTHEEPTFVVDGVTHYCVANMPGAVAQTSTYALTNVTLRYAQMIAKLGVEEACKKDEALKLGLNIYKGDLVYKQIADDLNLPYTALKL